MPLASDSGASDLAALLQAAAAGDDQAWRAIVALYARRIYALARSRLRGASAGGTGGGGAARGDGASGGGFGQGGTFPKGHDAAEEVTQSVFCTVATKLAQGEYSEQGRFESWLFRVAMNRIRDEVRRRKRHAAPTDPEVLSQSFVDERESAEKRARDGRASRDELDALRLAMDGLSDADREVVELRHHAQMSFKAIAEMLEEPIGTLLARHHRALRKLKELLGERGIGDEAGLGDDAGESAGRVGRDGGPRS